MPFTEPPRTRRRVATASSPVAAVLYQPDLLLEILHCLGREQGVRFIARAAAVCQAWRLAARPMASEWDALRLTASLRVRGQPSFVVGLPNLLLGGPRPLDDVLAVTGSGMEMKIFAAAGLHAPKGVLQTPAGLWASGLACDGGRFLYVADMLKSRLYKVNLPKGTLVDTASGFGHSGDRLASPQGLALHDGTLFVADNNNDRIAIWDTAPRLAFREAIGEHGQLRRPSGLAATPEHLYVADSANHRVCCFTHKGELVRAIGCYGAAPGQFQLPRGVAVCAGMLIVAEEGEGAPRVQVVAPDGTPHKPLLLPGGKLAGLWCDAARRQAFVADRKQGSVHALELCFGVRSLARSTAKRGAPAPAASPAGKRRKRAASPRTSPQ